MLNIEAKLLETQCLNMLNFLRTNNHITMEEYLNSKEDVLKEINNKYMKNVA